MGNIRTRAVAIAAITATAASCSLEEVPRAEAAAEGHLSAHVREASGTRADATTVGPDDATPVRPEARPADVESVDAILTAVYEVISGAAGEERDWERFLSLFYPDARLIPARSLPGRGELTIWSPDEYVEQVGPRLTDTGFFEVEVGRTEERFGIVAHAFSTYESRRTPGEAPFSRGINSFQLLEHDGRFWILQILWDSEGPERPIPVRYLEFIDWAG